MKTAKDYRYTYTRLSIDPTDLREGDIIVALNDHDESGCHCDVLVTVDRPSIRNPRLTPDAGSLENEVR